MPARRTDRGSIIVEASADTIFRAFDRDALMKWLPPGEMVGRILEWDFREGGRYRYELSYSARDVEAGRTGKTSREADVTSGIFVAIEPDRRIVQTVSFASDDPALAGDFTLTWVLEPVPEGTRVSVTAEDVPPGISAEDHDAGLRATLSNLRRYATDGGTR